jgi:hypothetical protein
VRWTRKKDPCPWVPGSREPPKKEISPLD